MSVDLILHIAALLLFLAGAIGVTTRVNLVALGLACWVLTTIV